MVKNRLAMRDGALHSRASSLYRIESKLSMEMSSSISGQWIPMAPPTRRQLLGLAGLFQPLEPGEGRAKFPTVGENDVQGVGADADIDGGRFKSDG